LSLQETAWLYSIDQFHLVKSVMATKGVFATHGGGNVCTGEEQIDTGYPPAPCKYVSWLHSTLERVWAHGTIANSPQPLWLDFHGFQYATDDPEAVAHRLSGNEIEARLEARLNRVGEESHPNLAGKLQYYDGVSHDEMLMMDNRWDQ